MPSDTPAHQHDGPAAHAPIQDASFFAALSALRQCGHRRTQQVLPAGLKRAGHVVPTRAERKLVRPCQYGQREIAARQIGLSCCHPRCQDPDSQSVQNGSSSACGILGLITQRKSPAASLIMSDCRYRGMGMSPGMRDGGAGWLRPGTGAAEIAASRELWTRANSEYGDEHALRAWAAPDIAWGIFNVPEQQLGALGDVRGLDVIELGCGTAHFSAWLARRGARPGWT